MTTRPGALPSNGSCWRVENRIACSACDYPQSEALYANIREWRHDCAKYLADDEMMDGYLRASAGAQLFGEPT